jgi:hypothetical protein
MIILKSLQQTWFCTCVCGAPAQLGLTVTVFSLGCQILHICGAAGAAEAAWGEGAACRGPGESLGRGKGTELMTS